MIHSRIVIFSTAVFCVLSGALGLYAYWNHHTGTDRSATLLPVRGTPWRTTSEHASTGWPSLHGPTGNGVCYQRGVNPAWPAAGPPALWSQKVGTGYSSPIVSQGRLILLHRQDDEEIIECFASDTGQSEWRFAYPTSYRCQYHYTSGPYSTPVIDGDRVYAVSATGVMHCVSLELGELVWSRDLMSDYEVEEKLFAAAASPLVLEDRLIFNLGAVQRDAGIIALDKLTGETLWEATDHDASCATPIAATIHNREYVFVVTFEGLVSLDPQTGDIHWEILFRCRAPDSVNAVSPVCHDDLVFMATGPGPGAICVRVLPDGSYKELWRDRRALDSQFNGLVCIDGYVYGFTSKNQDGVSYRCLDMRTGEIMWNLQSELGRGQALAVDNCIVLWGEHGQLGSVDVNPGKLVVRSMTANPLLEPPCYSSPAIENGLLFLRNESQLVCLDLRQQPYATD